MNDHDQARLDAELDEWTPPRRGGAVTREDLLASIVAQGRVAGITYHSNYGRPGPLANYEVDAAGHVWGGPFLTDRVSHAGGTVSYSIDDTTTDTTKEAGMSRLDTIKARMRELEAEAAALEAIPDPAAWEDDTTISYERSYESGNPFSQWYTYVAVKAGGQWYTTGVRNGHRYDDAGFRELLAGPDVRNVFRSTGWEAVAKVVTTDGTGAVVDE